MTEREKWLRYQVEISTLPYIDFRGHRYYPPYPCLCCGVDIPAHLFDFNRACDYCATGRCLVEYDCGEEVYEPGHRTGETVAAAQVVDVTKDCASPICVAHRLVNVNSKCCEVTE